MVKRAKLAAKKARRLLEVRTAQATMQHSKNGALRLNASFVTVQPKACGKHVATTTAFPAAHSSLWGSSVACTAA
jgi:hypothetical protein